MTALSIDPGRLAGLPIEERAEILAVLDEYDRRERGRRFDHYFPDETHTWRGQTFHARHLYPRHLEFFAAGRIVRERCFMAANRVGKTEGCGAYEVTCHLTGRYPPWWQGRVFEHPVAGWAAGKTNETTRDIIQRKLLGAVSHASGRKGLDGTGMIPAAAIGEITWKQGVADLADTILVRHEPTGGWSRLGLKSYQQGRGSFEGTEQHFVWLDEEPPADVYGECLIRTATTMGIVLLTFTPLEGMSEVVISFLPADQRPELAE